MAVRWSTFADNDLADIHEFLSATAGEDIADNILEKIRQDIYKLALTPMLARQDKTVETLTTRTLQILVCSGHQIFGILSSNWAKNY